MNIKTIQVGPLGVNCYVCSNESGEAAIIDPGDEAAVISKYISDNKLIPKAIILTHCHYDHICAVDELVEMYSVPVACYEGERENIIDASKNLSSMYYTEEITVTPDILLKDNEQFNPFSEGEGFFVFHTPGHTNGGASYYLKEANAVFTGDTLFNCSVGRSDFYSGNHGQLIDSIKSKLLTLPEETVVYPGHGEKSKIGYEKKHNPFLL